MKYSTAITLHTSSLSGRVGASTPDHLPTPPAGAPFPAPSYTGTPRNTLPFAHIPVGANQNDWSSWSNPYPAVIAVNPSDSSYWDWTPAMKTHLTALGLDTDMGKTRLGYSEDSEGSVSMVGMTPTGTMKSWVVIGDINQTWSLNKGQSAPEDLLWILRSIEAISAKTGGGLNSTGQLKVTSIPLTQISTIPKGMVSTVNLSSLLSKSSQYTQSIHNQSGNTNFLIPKIVVSSTLQLFRIREFYHQKPSP